MYSKDNDELLVQALPVESSSDDRGFDLNTVPTSGSEYLQRVRAEARQYEDIKVAETKEYEDINATETKEYANTQNCSKDKLVGCQGLLATLDWQNEQIKQFSQVRLRYEGYKLSNKQLTKKKKSISKSDSKEACFTFLYGNASKEVSGHDPLLSSMLHFDQILIENLLRLHEDWMSKQGFSHKMGSWLYSLLVAYEKPLSPEACWVLRGLAKECSRARISMGRECGEVAGVNLIICLITRYFDQADLADK